MMKGVGVNYSCAFSSNGPTEMHLIGRERPVLCDIREVGCSYSKIQIESHLPGIKFRTSS